MTGSPAFTLIDHGLTGLAGHNLTYARRVLRAAERAGFRTSAGVGTTAAHLDVGAPSRPVFPDDLWANNPGEGRRWHVGAFVTRRLARPPAAGTISTLAAPPRPASAAGAGETRGVRLLKGFSDDGRALLAGWRGAETFASALEAFMRAEALGSGDVAFMPTALAAELRGLRRLLARSAEARRVRWRILLRYAPDSPLVRGPLARAARGLVERRDVDVRLYSDTEQLCAFYERLCGVPVRLLPIPVDGEPASRPEPHATLTVGYFGDARDEKGFDHLPQVLGTIRERTSGAGSVQFLVQANLNTPTGDPRTGPARQALAAMAGADLRLVEGPLTPDAYDALFQAVDIVLLPYRPEHYGERSSGVLMEALMAGLPCVATAGQWMQSVLDGAHPPAGVTVAADPVSLAEGVLHVAADWAHYADGAHALAHRLRHRVDPGELVAELARA